MGLMGEMVTQRCPELPGDKALYASAPLRFFKKRNDEPD